MPIQTTQPNAPDQRDALLLSAVEVLLEELATLSGEDWEKLPELKMKKVVVAMHLRRSRAEAKVAGTTVAPIESLVASLENQSQQDIRSRLDLIGKQIVALQELGQYWRECQRVSFLGTGNRPLGNNASLV
jgi:hypothetical protein